MRDINKTIQEVYLTLGKKVLIHSVDKDLIPVPIERKYVVAFTLNLKSLGFMASKELIEVLESLDHESFISQTQDILDVLIKLNGSRKNMVPMYPDYPEVHMTTSETELYYQAIINYLERDTWQPFMKQAFYSESTLSLKTIELGSEEDLKKYISLLANSSVSMSDSQKGNLLELLTRYKDELDLDMFKMTNKENMVYTIHAIHSLGRTALAEGIACNHMKTSTDVLRLAMIFLEGDYTLSDTKIKLKSLKRSQRRMLLSLINTVYGNNKQALEDASLYQGLWVIVGEKLHPGDYSARYPLAHNFFNEIRNTKLRSWYSKLEKAYELKDVNEVVKLLNKRPGEFARRLERTMRLAIDDGGAVAYVVDEFAKIAHKVDTTILLQMQQFFADKYMKPSGFRTFIPKGNISKVYIKEDNRDPMGMFYYAYASRACMIGLTKKLSEREKLGKVYIDDNINGYALPLKQRTASKQLYSMAKGTRVKLPEDTNILRMYQWWKAPGHVDLDLAVMFLDSEFAKVTDEISYWNIKDEEIKCYHSGDIRSAKEGAAEFIDVDINALKEKNIRYAVMTISSYSHEPFCNLEECFAGIMALDEIKPHEKTFDPAKSLVRSDLSVNSRMAAPLVYDVLNHEVIWLDTPIPGIAEYLPVNTVTFKDSFINIVRGLLNASYPQFSTLVQLHCCARNAELVDTPEEADIVFSLDNGITPFSIEEITTNWL